MYDSLVDRVRPGDRVEVTGIFRSAPVRINQRQRKIRSIFRTFIDVVHVKVTDSMEKEEYSDSLSGDIASESENLASLEASLINEIIALSQSPNLYERLSSSIGTTHYIIISSAECMENGQCEEKFASSTFWWS